MNTFMTFLAFMLSLFALVSAAPIARDVWAPHILTPKAGTVWTAGHTYEVTWDTSDKPTQITNPVGQIILSKADRLDVDHPLASGFELTDGKVKVHIPKTTKTASDYAIVLFGDSGNASHEFKIKA